MQFCYARISRFFLYIFLLKHNTFFAVGAEASNEFNLYKVSIQARNLEETKKIIEQKKKAPDVLIMFPPLVPIIPLHRMIEDGSLEMAELFLRFNANVNHADSIGQTALHKAKNPDAISLLMFHGANLRVVDNNGKTPLTTVQSADCVKKLLIAASYNYVSPEQSKELEENGKILGHLATFFIGSTTKRQARLPIDVFEYIILNYLPTYVTPGMIARLLIKFHAQTSFFRKNYPDEFVFQALRIAERKKQNTLPAKNALTKYLFNKADEYRQTSCKEDFSLNENDEAEKRKLLDLTNNGVLKKAITAHINDRIKKTNIQKKN